MAPADDADAAADDVGLEQAVRGGGGQPLQVRGLEILAPMVRASTLPLRLECLRYGAGLVFGEEIVDKKILDAVRVENPSFGTVDFVSPREKVNIFSTCAEERSRVIFQVGTASAPLAVQAASVVCRDVRGIDVNMGCPKSFSVKGGMGAALLQKPEIVADILTSLRRNLPSQCSLTCKIRMLATPEKTREFMQICERSGAEAITVHMRWREERPADPAHWDMIMPLWDAVRVPVVANGDFFSRRQISEFWRHCRGSAASDGAEASSGSGASAGGPDPAGGGPAGIMIARGAMWNPSIFSREQTPPPFEEVVRRYTRTAVSVNAPYQNTKWVLASMLAGGTGVTPPSEFRGSPIKAFNQKLSVTKSMGALCEMIGEDYNASCYPQHAHTTVYYRQRDLCAAAADVGAGAEPQAAAVEADASAAGGEGDSVGESARKRARLEP
eukprot:TRINITY_DN47998_c0_g1_i1.p1 TRINITY_DN47998_c0_g1~~TRINITY_DN47998_c0_g1_i1.p1  ORF type:complete len:442 (+),score=96.18 TRINITY_DN47998_c0_g1_i1:86-1411(+)